MMRCPKVFRCTVCGTTVRGLRHGRDWFPHSHGSGWPLCPGSRVPAVITDQPAVDEYSKTLRPLPVDSLTLITDRWDRETVIRMRRGDPIGEVVAHLVEAYLSRLNEAAWEFSDGAGI